MKRFFDVSLALFSLIFLCVPFVFLALAVRVTSKGPVLYWSDRIGRYNKIFRMPKLRTMTVDAPVIATHLLVNPDEFLTPIGSFLRRSSLDELPQLWNILVGEMSFVGPRPALFNQNDLVALRNEHGIDKLTPGLTGWAQINGRDELPIQEKVMLDKVYLSRQSLMFDLRILCTTFLKVIQKDGVAH
jgi:O-antigen biosynthesis protein WbqP